MDNKVIIFISGAWPGYTTGYEIANLSTLDYFNSKAKHCLYFGPSESYLDPDIEQKFNKTEFIGQNFDRKPIAFRFLKSLISAYPAITERFWNKETTIINTIKNSPYHNHEFVFIYEDVPAAYLLFKLKSAFKNALHVVRSHNVVYKGFLGMANNNNPIVNRLWKLELKKINKFEKRLFNEADKFYAISNDDLSCYKELMDINPDGIIELYIDHDKYERVKNANDHIIFLGSADLRKSIGLKNFIEKAWPEILKKLPESKLLLGGRNTEKFTNRNQNIYGYGFIENETEFLSKGTIFINPQTEGAGINLKSIIAVASGKVLVSTELGVEGTNFLDNKHCVVRNEYSEQASEIISLLRGEKDPATFIEEGKNFVCQHFSKKAFFRKMDTIFSQN